MPFVVGHMEIRDFAKSVLFGTTLAEKLIAPDVLTDLCPGLAIVGPEWPGRPLGLGLKEWHARPKTTFPTTESLSNPRHRGLVLHFFANHELLAMEIMALVLLKFPGSPAAFREGIARTILEEQSHMRLYQARMEELGVGFGDIAVNDFFWSCLAPMRSPMEFVTQMSLTFEQANLDFSLHYARLFRTLGDTSTADIMDTVYREEIGHVKHGLTWFQRWKEPGQSEWDAFRKELRFPLNPSRAKGLAFSVEARKAAGFSDEYIHELAVFSQSKGRPPKVFWFNQWCESEVASRTVGSFTAPAHIQALSEDLCLLMMHVASHDDVVLVKEKPRIEFLAALRKSGFALPEFVVCDGSKNGVVQSLMGRVLGAPQPWGWSPDAVAFFSPLASQVSGLDPVWERLGATNVGAGRKEWPWRAFFAKTWSAALLADWIASQPPEHANKVCPLSACGLVCVSMEEVLEAIACVFSSQQSKLCVLKKPLASSGQGQLKVSSQALSLRDQSWVVQTLKSQGAIVVEPWLSRVADFSIQFKVEPDGRTKVLGVTRFFVDTRGQYRGTLLGKRWEGLSDDTLRALQAHSREGFELFKQLELAARFAGDALFKEGFQGPAGIDAFLYRDDTGVQGLRLKPIVEINPRFTMGRVALELAKRLAPGSCGVWLHVTLAHLKDSGFESALAFEESLEALLPFESLPGERPLIRKGAIFTTDPGLAKAAVSVLLVSSDLGAILDALSEISGKAMEWVGFIK